MVDAKRTSLILLALVILSVLWPQALSAQTSDRTSAPVVTSDLKNPSYFAIGTTVMFTGMASDDVGVISLEITFTNGLTWVDITSSYNNITTKYSYLWDTTGQTSGSHPITIKAKDGENKAGSALVGLVLDDNQPDVAIKQPSGSAVTLGLGDTIALSGTASDTTTPLTFLNLSTDGGQNWIPAKLGRDLGKYSFREWTLAASLKAGASEIKVRATSNGGDTQPLEPRWNPAGYLRNVVETVRVTAA